MNKKILGIVATLLLCSCSPRDTPKQSQQQSISGANTAAISQSGRYSIIAAPGQSAQFWDLSTHKMLYEWKHDIQTPPHMTAVAISPDDGFAVTADQHQVVLWNVASGHIDAFMHLSSHALAVSPSLQSQSVLVGLDRNKAELLDLRGKKTLAELSHEGRVSAVALSNDGQFAVTGSDDKTAQYWDLKSKTVLRKFTHTRPVKTVALSKQRHWIFTGAGKGEQRVWDAKTGDLVLRLTPDARSSTTALFSPDEKWLAVGRQSGQLQLWDLNTQKMLQEWHLPSRKILALGFSPDLHSIYTEDASGLWSVWEIH